MFTHTQGDGIISPYMKKERTYLVCPMKLQQFVAMKAIASET